MTIRADSPIEEVAAVVSEALTNAGITAVLSGGGAVQIYSAGLYKSRDLDFVTPDSIRQIAKAVEVLGFNRTVGRHFQHVDSPFTLEFPPWPLAVGRTVLQEWTERRVPHGVIKMLNPTQCVMDRLAAFYHWKDRQALDQAIAVARAHAVDAEEIRRWSKAEGRETEFRQFIQRV